MNIQEASDTLDIDKLLKIFINYKRFILIGAFGISVFCIIYAFLLTPIYKSSTLLEPNPNLGPTENSALSGAASLVGLDLSSPIGNGADIVTVAIKIILSKDFLEEIIQEDELFLPELIAVKSYDKSNNKVIFDSALYNYDKKSWVPSDIELLFPFHDIYLKFVRDHIKVEKDQLSKLTTISIYHSSPYVAKRWLDLILQKINQTMRARALIESNESITFLNKQLEETTIKELRTAISNSIEKELNNLMYAQISSDYIFKVIDSPRVSSVQDKPNKKSIVIIGTIAGFIFLSIISIIHNFFLSRRA